MAPVDQYRWETIRVATIVATIATMVLLGRLARDPAAEARQAQREQQLFEKLTTAPTIPAVRAFPASDAAALNPGQPVASPPSDPSEVTVGASGISNRYKLERVDRKKETAHDVLIVSLHVESVATEGFVSPFESDMLEISSPDMQPIKPNAPFRSPIPSGNSRNREIGFNVPPTLNLDRASLRIHYYNYENEIPLNTLARKTSMTTQATAQ
jgi:hypothetical protein